MAKIKFDLPIDGVKAATLDDLRGHFTAEIIGPYRSGLLARWLRSRDLTRELAAVEALEAGDDATTLKELCRIFEVEADDDAIEAAVAEATGVPGTNIRKSHSNSHEHAHSRSNELALWLNAVTYDMLNNTADFYPDPPSGYNLYRTVNSPPSKSDTKGQWVDYLYCYIEHCYFVLGMLRTCPDREWASDMSQHIQSCLDQACLILGIRTCSEDDLRFRPRESPRLKDELFQLLRESNLLHFTK